MEIEELKGQTKSEKVDDKISRTKNFLDSLPKQISNVLDLSKMQICCVCGVCLEGLTHICNVSDNRLACLKCFALKGQNPEVGFKDYQVMNSLDIEPFVERWTLKEELIFLNALADFGFGNWKDISKRLPKKTKDECEQHYMRVSPAESVLLCAQRKDPRP